jgi:hypothetical protein
MFRATLFFFSKIGAYQFVRFDTVETIVNPTHVLTDNVAIVKNVTGHIGGIAKLVGTHDLVKFYGNILFSSVIEAFYVLFAFVICYLAGLALGQFIWYNMISIIIYPGNIALFSAIVIIAIVFIINDFLTKNLDPYLKVQLKLIGKNCKFQEEIKTPKMIYDSGWKKEHEGKEVKLPPVELPNVPVPDAITNFQSPLLDQVLPGLLKKDDVRGQSTDSKTVTPGGEIKPADLKYRPIPWETYFRICREIDVSDIEIEALKQLILQVTIIGLFFLGIMVFVPNTLDGTFQIALTILIPIVPRLTSAAFMATRTLDGGIFDSRFEKAYVKVEEAVFQAELAANKDTENPPVKLSFAAIHEDLALDLVGLANH